MKIRIFSCPLWSPVTSSELSCKQVLWVKALNDGSGVEAQTSSCMYMWSNPAPFSIWIVYPWLLQVLNWTRVTRQDLQFIFLIQKKFFQFFHGLKNWPRFAQQTSTHSSKHSNKYDKKASNLQILSFPFPWQIKCLCSASSYNFFHNYLFPQFILGSWQGCDWCCTSPS